MTMEHLLVAATAVDLIAVVALAWVVLRGARERELAGAAQRDTLERLRDELGHLLEQAETRAHALERTLRGDRRDTRRGASPEEPERTGARPAARRPAAPPTTLQRSWIEEEDDGADAALREELAVDPAEVRLRRELELSLGKSRLA